MSSIEDGYCFPTKPTQPITISEEARKMKTPEEWSLIFGRTAPESLKLPDIPDKLHPKPSKFICVLDEKDIEAIQTDTINSATSAKDKKTIEEKDKRIQELEQELNAGIHSCAGKDCQRIECRQRREINQLSTQLIELREALQEEVGRYEWGHSFPEDFYKSNSHFGHCSCQCGDVRQCSICGTFYKMKDALSSAPDDIHKNWVRREVLKKCEYALQLDAIASCTCLTKTPESIHHKIDCRYRWIAEALTLAQQELEKVK